MLLEGLSIPVKFIKSPRNHGIDFLRRKKNADIGAIYNQRGACCSRRKPNWPWCGGP
jgi:hypothetical protein